MQPLAPCSCPVCQTPDTWLRYTLREKRVFWCRSCHLHFVDPFPDATGLQSSYDDAVSEFQRKYFGSFQDLRSKSFVRGLETLSRLNRKGNLLDVGPGLGFFLDEARRKGWQGEGLELSEKMAEHARRTLQLPIQMGTLESAPLKTGQYEVVTLWDVLEHLPDPKGALLKIHALLLPKGLVVIRTPVCDSLLPWVLNFFYRASLGKLRSGFEKLFQEHLFHFSEKGLRELLGRCGFHPIHHYREDYIDPHALARKEWAGHPLVRWGVFAVIVTSHWIQRQDEVVIYAEAIRS